jgi:predicted Fe-S protein YdhL (DUF1289 family)
LISARELLLEQARRVAADEVAAVPSPCVSVCRMDMHTELCEGCLRTLDEIAAWGRMADEEKKQVWALVAQRIGKETP